MKEGFDPKNINRSILSKLLLEKGYSAGEALKIVESMRGKSDEEKERIAAHLILEFVTQQNL